MFNKFIEETYDEYKHQRKLKKGIYKFISDCDCIEVTLIKYDDGKTASYVWYESEDDEYSTGSESYYNVSSFDFKDAYKETARNILGFANYEDIDFEEISKSREYKIIQNIKLFLDSIEDQYKKFELNQKLKADLKVSTKNKSIIKV
jgi:hypothetical protein